MHAENKGSQVLIIRTRSFIYLNQIVEDKDDILWFPSGLKREFSPHFARLLASLCDEGKGEGEQGGARGVGVTIIIGSLLLAAGRI